MEIDELDIIRNSNYKNYKNKKELFQIYCNESSLEIVKELYLLFKPFFLEYDLIHDDVHQQY